MASVGGDVAADDRDDFGVGALGLHAAKRALLKASHERCSRGTPAHSCGFLRPIPLLLRDERGGLSLVPVLFSNFYFLVPE